MTADNQPAPPLVERANQFAERTAIVAGGEPHTYAELLDASQRAAARLLATAGVDDLAEARVAFLVPAGWEYVVAQWGIWRAGGVAVPLAVMHPAAELSYTIDDSQATLLVAHPSLAEWIEPLAEEKQLPLVSTDNLFTGDLSKGESVPLPAVDPSRRAMILYTSGTTSRPKGVVTTHECIAAQIASLVEAWQWTKEDAIPHFLPLHHIHGIINVLRCALWSGAACHFLPKFDADEVLETIRQSEELTLFMAVPTIYARLVAAWQTASPEEQASFTAGCGRLRLMVSGSAALPVSTLEEWREISGHTLLERYGMTEIGMGLSNPYKGERLPGHVGRPLPGVEARLMAEDGQPAADGVSGEIQIRGATLFREYWQRPEATAESFTEDGWFRTGDIAIREHGAWRILGRNSVDIIKTGGYKVSALEVEEVLRTHPAVAQCAVVATPCDEWGERVSAALVLKPTAELDLPALRAWGKELLAPYKIPSRLLLLDELPKNAMGKVTKPAIVEQFAGEAE